MNRKQQANRVINAALLENVQEQTLDYQEAELSCYDDFENWALEQEFSALQDRASEYDDYDPYDYDYGYDRHDDPFYDVHFEECEF